MQRQFSYQVPSARVASLFNPCTNGELMGGFTAAPALGALLHDDIPLPAGPGEVEFRFLTHAGGFMPTTVVSVIVDRAMAFHWFLDISDPVTWEILDAWMPSEGARCTSITRGRR